jgi:hypothetical protein
MGQPTLGVSISDDVSLLTGVLLSFYNRGIKPGEDDSGVVYGPGVTVDFNLPASDQDQQVDLERNAEHPRNIIYDTLFIATEHLGNVPGLETPGAVVDCIENAQAPDLASIIGCVHGIAEHVADDATATARLAAIDRALNVLSLIRSGSEYLALAVQGGRAGINGTVLFRLKRPVIAASGPPTDGNPATARGARILKRTGSTASYVLDESGVAHHIPDGGTYICNAQHYLVQFNVDDAEWAAQVRSVGTDATCPSGKGRGLGPKTVPAGVLLRLEEEGDMFLTSTWNGESRLVPVFGGQEIFDCMVEKYLAWDWVTYDEYDNFRHHPIEAAVGGGVILQP